MLKKWYIILLAVHGHKPDSIALGSILNILD